ncbi:MAG: hypothetical protein ACYTDX_06650 [Planctomycetota bacterium]|jgi:hypothetical protein
MRRTYTLALVTASLLPACAAPPRTDAFETRLAAATAAMDAGQWQRAADLLEDAHRETWSTESRARLETCENALAAESAATAGDEGDSRALFAEAEGGGFAAEALERSRRARLPHSYEVTVHSAAILPYDPETETPWDGPSVRIKDAARLLAGLISLFVDGGFAVSIAADYIVRTVSATLEPPDCTLAVLVGDVLHGDPEAAVEDSYHPSWDLSFTVRGTTGDPRVTTIEVADEDLVDHDAVGSWQITVGDLVSTSGVREIQLLNADGTLLAGGIAGLRISVRPLD